MNAIRQHAPHRRAAWCGARGDVYDTDLADLWSAITEPDRLARWVATVEGDLRLGG